MNPLKWSFRTAFAVAAVVCLALLGYAFYAQYKLHLEPCPLCMFQRFAFFGLTIVAIVAAIHAPKSAIGKRVYGALALLASSIGIGVAGWHVWLQHLPPEDVPACGPGLDYLLDTLPLTDVVRKVFTASGQCAEVNWTFWGLSMPEWTLIWFVLFALGSAYYGFRRYAD